MKITTFDPVILSEDAGEIIAFFEELGFEQRHHKEDISNADITLVRMRNESGYHVDVVDAPVSKCMTAIRMNVDIHPRKRHSPFARKKKHKMPIRIAPPPTAMSATDPF